LAIPETQGIGEVFLGLARSLAKRSQSPRN
jgi:hypothetical protein